MSGFIATSPSSWANRLDKKHSITFWKPLASRSFSFVFLSTSLKLFHCFGNLLRTAVNFIDHAMITGNFLVSKTKNRLSIEITFETHENVHKIVQNIEAQEMSHRKSKLFSLQASTGTKISKKCSFLLPDFTYPMLALCVHCTFEFHE